MENKKKELYELPSQVITYKIPEINPFIDTLIIEMTSKIEKDLFNKT